MTQQLEAEGGTQLELADRLGREPLGRRERPRPPDLDRGLQHLHQPQLDTQLQPREGGGRLSRLHLLPQSGDLPPHGLLLLAHPLHLGRHLDAEQPVRNSRTRRGTPGSGRPADRRPSPHTSPRAPGPQCLIHFHKRELESNMALNPQYEQIGKAFTEQYYNIFDNAATRANLQQLYNLEQSLLSFEGQ